MIAKRLRDDQAVSVIIGAVLLLAIVVSALVAFRLAYVPVAGERAEHDHMKDVSRAMGSLNAEILKGAQDPTGVPFPTSIPMTGTYPPLVPGQPPGGTLELSGERSVTIQADDLTVFTKDGAPVSSDEWSLVDETTTLTSIEDVLQFRVKLLDALAPGDEFKVEITDAENEFAGSVTVQGTGTDRIDLRVHNENQESVYFERVYNDTADFQDQHRFNLLADTLGFDALLNQAETPFNLTVEPPQGVDIEHTIVYEETSNGISRLAGHGQTIASYHESWTTGTLSFATAYQFFVRQSFVLDHGAMIMEQTDGAVFTVEPPLRVEATDDLTTVHLLTPSITGDGFSISSGDRVEVHTTPDKTQRFHASANSLTLTFATPFQDQWSDHLHETFQEAGLEDGPDYTVEPDTNDRSIKATLHGTNHDLALSFIQGEIQTEVTR